MTFVLLRKLIYRCRQLEAEKSIGLSDEVEDDARAYKRRRKRKRERVKKAESLIHENLFAKWKGASALRVTGFFSVI